MTALWVALLAGCGGAGTGGTPPGPAMDAGLDAAPEPAADAEPADAAPLERVWFVEVGAVDGDGSRARPFGEPAAAYAVARAGDTVLLLPGAHPAPGAPPAEVVLSGAGADVTTITGPWRIDAPVIARELAVDGALTVAAAASLDAVAVRGALAVDDALTARDLSVDGEATVGVDGRLDVRGGDFIGDGEAALRSAGEARLDAITASAPAGSAIVVEGGALVMTGARVEQAIIGVEVTGGRATVEDSVFSAIEDPGALGAAVRVRAGEARLDTVTIEDVTRALRVDADARLVANGVLARRVATDGLSMQGGEAEVDGLRVEDAGNAGVAVIREGRLTLDGATIVGAGRVGVLVDGATLDARALSVEGAAARGVGLARAVATLDGFIVTGAGDVGVQITDPVGAIRLVNGQISDCRTSGVAVFGAGQITVEAVVVEGTTRGEGDLGEGLHIYRGFARMEGVITRDNAGAGVLYEESNGTLTEVQASGNGDPGVVVLDPSGPISAARLIARDNGGAGVVTLGGRFELVESLAEGNRAALGVGPGHGFYAGFGGALDVQQSVAVGNAGSGVAYELGTSGRLEAVELRDNRGYGLLVGCGAMVSDDGELVFSGNAAGERGGCP